MGSRTTVFSAPFWKTWSHWLGSWQTTRMSWSADVALQSRIVHPPADVKSEMELFEPDYE